MTSSHALLHRNHVRARLHAAALGCFSLILALSCAVPAHAVNKGNIGKMSISQNGRSTTLTYPPQTNVGGSQIPVSPSMGGWTQAGNYGVPTSATGPTAGHLTSNGEFIVGGSGVKYPVQSKAPIPWGALAPVAAGVVCVMTTAGWCAVAAGVAAGAPGIMDWMNSRGLQRDPETGEITKFSDSGPPVPRSDGYEFRAENINIWYQTKDMACQSYIDKFMTPSARFIQGYKGVNQLVCSVGWNSGSLSPTDVQLIRRVNYLCNPGDYIKPDGTCTPSNPSEKRRLTPEEVANELTQGNPPDGRPWGETLERGGEVPMPDPTVTGPSSVSGPETVTHKADGSKTVTNTTYHFTTNNNTVTNTHNTTITNYYNSSNQLIGTDTTTTTPSESEVPPPEQKGLCELYPDILACAKVPEADTPDGEVPRDDKELTYQEENLFGGGNCPANLTMTVQSTGQSMTVWDWQSACDHMLPIRAIVMTLAAFSAFLILMPGGPKE